MKLSNSFKAALLTCAALSLGACQLSTASYVKAADGSVQIVDSNPDRVPTVVGFYRTAGRKAAKVCALHGGSNDRIISEMTKLGYSEKRTLFGPRLKLKAPSFEYAPVSMDPSSPCEFTFASSAGESFYEGAKATLIEMGYSQSGSGNWTRGSANISMTGSMRTSTSGATSHVEILRQ